MYDVILLINIESLNKKDTLKVAAKIVLHLSSDNIIVSTSAKTTTANRMLSKYKDNYNLSGENARVFPSKSNHKNKQDVCLDLQLL